MNTNKSCSFCKKSGHNITTCIPAVKQGILLENHIYAMKEVSTNISNFRCKLVYYLRKLSIQQKKILCCRMGEKQLSESVVYRYIRDKIKSRNVMQRVHGDKCSSICFIANSKPYESISISSPTSSEKYERKVL